MDENQDRSAILTAPYGERTLLVVADGLGGHSGASLAAQTVIDTAKRLWRQKAQPSKPEDFLQRLALESHAAINDAARSTGLEPRTTLAAFLAMGTSVVSVHAGDSRVMQINDDGLVKQTLDHSIARIKVMCGAISEEELATHPDQKRLYSHLGGEEDPHFEITRWDLSAGQRFVVCSDGFWEIFPVAEIQSLFDAHDPGRTLATGFREKLASLKSHDNTTAILAQVQPGAAGRLVLGRCRSPCCAGSSHTRAARQCRRGAAGASGPAGTPGSRRNSQRPPRNEDRRPSNGADWTLGPACGSRSRCSGDHIGRRGFRLRRQPACHRNSKREDPSQAR